MRSDLIHTRSDLTEVRSDLTLTRTDLNYVRSSKMANNFKLKIDPNLVVILFIASVYLEW